MVRETRRPLFDGTTWLMVLWLLALAVGVGAGVLTMGDMPEGGSSDETAAAVRDFMVGAGPFWIVSGVALVASFALDELTVQLRRRDESSA